MLSVGSAEGNDLVVLVQGREHVGVYVLVDEVEGRELVALSRSAVRSRRHRTLGQGQWS